MQTNLLLAHMDVLIKLCTHAIYKRNSINVSGSICDLILNILTINVLNEKKETCKNFQARNSISKHVNKILFNKDLFSFYIAMKISFSIDMNK